MLLSTDFGIHPGFSSAMVPRCSPLMSVCACEFLTLLDPNVHQLISFTSSLQRTLTLNHTSDVTMNLHRIPTCAGLWRTFMCLWACAFEAT